MHLSTQRERKKELKRKCTVLLTLLREVNNKEGNREKVHFLLGEGINNETNT